MVGDLTGDSDQRFAAHLKEGELESQPEINLTLDDFYMHVKSMNGVQEDEKKGSDV